MINDAKLTKARKDHKCCLCGGDIKQNDQYYAETWYPWMMIEDPIFYQYKAHIKCHEFIKIDFKYWYDSSEGFTPPYEVGNHRIFIDRMNQCHVNK